jgi:hypothetical protein
MLLSPFKTQLIGILQQGIVEIKFVYLFILFKRLNSYYYKVLNKKILLFNDFK